MSTGAKRPLATALADAEALRDLFPRETYARWEIAGSVRRGKPEVSDVEHVVVPVLGDVPGTDLFATPSLCNLLFRQLDDLVAGKLLFKHAYDTDETGAPRYRWGPKFRGVDFRGFNHEITCAEPDAWGSALAIKTGPAEFSRRLVTGLLRNGRRNHEGRVWSCKPCTWCADLKFLDYLCKGCNGTKLECVEAIPCRYEREYFELCGMNWVEPGDRREGY